MSETSELVSKTVKPGLTMREKAAIANQAIDYDLNSGEYFLDTKSCPYWLAKFFGKRGDEAFVVRQVRRILTEISRGEETVEGAVDKAAPNPGYDCTVIFGKWFGAVSYDAFGSAGRAYEVVKNRGTTQDVDFEGICRAGFEQYMTAFARELFAAMKE